MNNTIPQSIKEKIEKKFPYVNKSMGDLKVIDALNVRILSERQAAIWGAFELDKWIELKEGCEMPDYDVPVLWLFEDGNMQVIDLDKDGNPWLYESEGDGFKHAKATHYQYLPKPPKDI